MVGVRMPDPVTRFVRTDAEIVAFMKEQFCGEYAWGDAAHLPDEWIVAEYHGLNRRLLPHLARTEVHNGR